jgi:hypothetical protein
MAAYPYRVTPELRRELALSKLTLEEALVGCDPPPPPEVLCKLLRTWRNLTPQQKAAWEEAAARENERLSRAAQQN